MGNWKISNQKYNENLFTSQSALQNIDKKRKILLSSKGLKLSIGNLVNLFDAPYYMLLILLPVKEALKILPFSN